MEQETLLTIEKATFLSLDFDIVNTLDPPSDTNSLSDAIDNYTKIYNPIIIIAKVKDDNNEIGFLCERSDKSVVIPYFHVEVIAEYINGKIDKDELYLKLDNVIKSNQRTN